MNSKERPAACTNTFFMRCFNWFISRLSMKYVCDLFVDKVSGRVVKLYVDCYGYEYMANAKYSWRCPRK